MPNSGWSFASIVFVDSHLTGAGQKKALEKKSKA
jgi:hypothetical protein